MFRHMTVWSTWY